MRIKFLILPGVAAAAVVVVALVLAGHRTGALAGHRTGALAGHRIASSSRRGETVMSGKVASVKIYMYSFMPDTLTVKAGTRVTFTNDDQTAHTATANGGSFDTGTIDPGKRMTVVFKRPGTYAYHCSFHAFMTGTIKVIGRGQI